MLQPSDTQIERMRNPSAATQTLDVHAPVVIDMRGLSLTYAASDTPVIALSDINLQIRAGEFVSLIGPSGCGKTTLLRVIADLAQSTGGTISVNGMSPEEARIARAYGYVFQAPALYAWRSVQRNIMLPLEIMGIPAEERARAPSATSPWSASTGSSANSPGSSPAACNSASRSRAPSASSPSSC